MLKPPVSIDSLMKEWSEDSIIDSSAMEKETLKTSFLHGKYLNIMSFHRHMVKKIEADYKILKDVKSDYYNGRLSYEELKEKDWEPLQHRYTNREIEEKIQGDADLNKMLLKKIAHEEIVSYCESVLRSLNSRTWDLKTYVEYLKYTNPNR